MDRRKAMKVAAGVFAGGGIGLFSIANMFKTSNKTDSAPHRLDYEPIEAGWDYFHLDPDESAQRAYEFYVEGGCMYSMVKSIITQLAENDAGHYKSFPFHMFKYGHGGIGGYGSVCGTLNGAAALISLFVPDKIIQDKVISDIFQWYEKEPSPTFIPVHPAFEYAPVTSIPNSVLCHVSNTNWCNTSGFKISSNERKEKCRRLTADVAKKVTLALNELHSNQYVTNVYSDETISTCISCHGKEGKLKNVSGKMTCNSCHTESVGHRVFSDIHYKMMNE